VLALIESTVKVPLVYDQNSMALRRIDVAQVKVTLDADRAYAVKILSRALGQARLKHELRLDENGKPFVWITPFGGGQ